MKLLSYSQVVTHSEKMLNNVGTCSLQNWPRVSIGTISVINKIILCWLGDKTC